MSRPPRRWLGGFGGFEWHSDDRGFAALLDALTRDRLEAEAVEREMSASARRSPADLKESQRAAERSELEDARRELAEFRSALLDARSRAHRDDRAEVAYDSSNPSQNAAADLLIQYLVRPGYAEVRTEEPTAARYVYWIRIDWPKLRALARGHGVQLPT
jgi:hypothetical protein